jgi:hypothetical protein
MYAWPQSRRLALELADLVDHFPAHLGRIRRVLFSPPEWDPAPAASWSRVGYVKVGSFSGDDTHVFHLTTLGPHRARRLGRAARVHRKPRRGGTTGFFHAGEHALGGRHPRGGHGSSAGRSGPLLVPSKTPPDRDRLVRPGVV